MQTIEANQPLLRRVDVPASVFEIARRIQAGELQRIVVTPDMIGATICSSEAIRLMATAAAQQASVQEIDTLARGVLAVMETLPDTAMTGRDILDLMDKDDGNASADLDLRAVEAALARLARMHLVRRARDDGAWLLTERGARQ